jgi:hypothetical protein
VNAVANQLNGDRSTTTPVLEVSNLVKEFPIRSLQGVRVIRGLVQAVSNISFSIDGGTTVGLVGESGSGKSTVARCVLQLLVPTSGSVKYNGIELVGMSRKTIQPLRQEMPMLAHRVRKAAIGGRAKIGFLNPRRFDYLFPVAACSVGGAARRGLAALVRPAIFARVPAVSDSASGWPVRWRWNRS